MRCGSDKLVRQGYRNVLNPPKLPNESHLPNHSWRSLKPVTTVQFWPAQAAVTGRNLSWVSNDEPTLTTVVRTATGTFYPSMVRQKIVTGLGTHTVLAYISSTDIRIDYYSVNGPSDFSGAVTWTMAAGNYGMPDDFGGIEHPLTEDAPTSHRQPVRITGSAQIREQRNHVLDQTGYPRFAGLTPRNDVAQVDTSVSPSVMPKVSRLDMWLWPIPEQVYTLRLRYIALMQKLTVANPYPIGGMMMSEVVMASCLAAAEFARYRERRHYYADFMDKLASAISYDRQAIATEFFGVMQDGGDDLDGDGHGNKATLTVAGETIY